jgi:myo-inositol-1-phosphate synthase
VTSQLELACENVHIGPSDYVAWLTYRKCAYIRLEVRAVGDVPSTTELTLVVWDQTHIRAGAAREGLSARADPDDVFGRREAGRVH